MSRLIRSPLVVDSEKFSFSLEREKNLLFIKKEGNLYNCHFPKLSDLEIKINNDEKKTYLMFKPLGDLKSNSKYAASFKMSVKNMIKDLETKFSLEISLSGVGFKVEKKDNFLSFSIGYSHRVFYKIPENVEIEISGNTKFKIIGFKNDCSLYASKLEKIRKYNPYGKTGIMISGKFYIKKDVKKSW